MLKALAIVFFFALINGEIFPRQCRTIEEYGGVVDNFSYPAYSGLWYEIERYDSPMQTGADCNQASYTNEVGSVYTYVVQYQQRNLVNGVRSSATGRSRVSFPDETPLRGMLNTTMVPGGVTDTSNYWILSTDYANYAFVVNCVNVDENSSRENYWLLGRSYPLPEAARERANTLIERFLDASRIRPTEHDFARCQL